MKVLRLLCGVFMPLLSFRGSVRTAAVNAVPTLEGSASTSDVKCWVFQHLQKCGGTTVKKILKDTFAHKYKIYDHVQWKRGSEYIQSTGNKLANGEINMIVGGYPEALRHSSFANETCKWFTVFRHPVSRMVSAYFYCKKSRGDRLCGSIIYANNIDLITFAKHWGNFAMRQFALGQVSVDDVLDYSKTDAAKEKAPMARRASGWYMLKVYLDDQATTSECAELPDAAMYEMLQPVQDLLRDRYTVGILEEFNTTLSLFDAALEMPELDWHKKFEGEGKQNVDLDFEEKAAALAEAWTNSELKNYMQLDLVLYEHAVDVFHEQARAYGLE